jgi:hypothetical protein
LMGKLCPTALSYYVSTLHLLRFCRKLNRCGVLK